MPICGILGCTNRPGVQKELSFYKVPKVIYDQGDETRKLSEKRRYSWKAAINRKDITSEEKWERTIVCSKHFVGGKKAYSHDKCNPAWLPTLNLVTKDSPSEDNSKRYLRACKRKEKRKVAEALLSLKKRKIDFDDNDANPTNTDVGEVDNDVIDEGTPMYSGCAVQTTLKSADIEQLENELSAKISERQHKSSMCNDLYSFHYYEKNPDKVSFYTGLPNFQTLKLVYTFVEKYLPTYEGTCLSKECAFLLCILKMRINYLFEDIAKQLSVSISMIECAFHDTLDVLYDRLNFLVRWPKREVLRTSMPRCLREKFGEKLVVVFDCFELFTERPSDALNEVCTYSNYKHHQSVKYLIGIAPQGVVTFISEGWADEISEQFLTEKSGVLDNLLPGDIVMVDRGFNIEESVNFYQAEMVVLSFARGIYKKKLYPFDVEKNGKIASVRIHVERIFGHILRKFHIFEGIIPVEFIRLRNGETIPTIDKLVFVAFALTNLCVSIVPYD